VPADPHHQRRGLRRHPQPRGPRDGLPGFRLKKGDGTIYDVAATARGVTCDCPDHLFNRDGKDVAGCKHVKAMKACGLL
jgi:hypothetical protein